jgi:nucleotidyltransferase substrate binding protein (TIGR01987 family)
LEKLTQSYAVFSRALQTLKEILQESKNTIVRDASIQRFEYTFESAWKILKVYLYTIEGIDCGSPKSCFRQALPTGVLTVEEVENALSMCDDRNLTSHTYLETVAEKIYVKLPEYLRILEKLEMKIGEKLK